jgi:hypothetical protein
MRHASIPQSLTPENLATWILDNKDSTFQHIEKTELTEETVRDYEHKSSLASRAIDRLNEVKNTFMETLKNGTPDLDKPVDVTIPPTKGLKVLTANREFADKQLEQGFSEELIDIYMVADPENSRMIAMDIEGKEWESFSSDMTEEQHKKYGKLFKKEKKGKIKAAVGDGPIVEGDSPSLDF